MDLQVNGRFYHLCARLYCSETVIVFSGKDLDSGGQVAVKVQLNCNEFDDDIAGPLKIEAQNYRQLKGTQGVAQFHAFESNDEYSTLVLSLLGPSLADLQAYVHGKLSMRTVLILAQRLLALLKKIHHQGLVHRDIKPENIAIGTLPREQNQFFLLDFNLATQQNEGGGGFTGTYAYASVRTHFEYAACPADDLESLLYTLIFLAKGTLPWLSAVGTGELRGWKQYISTEDLCQDLPEAFAEYHRYLRSLDPPTRKPAYGKLMRFFLDSFKAEGFQMGGEEFDWIEEAKKNLQPRRSSRLKAKGDSAPRGRGRKRGGVRK